MSRSSAGPGQPRKSAEMAVFQHKTGEPPLATIPLSGLSLRIGRRSSCKIFINSKDVSREHAAGYHVAGHFPLFHIQAHQIIRVTEDGSAGPPPGPVRDACQDLELCFADDDVLPLCSDGIARLTGDGRTQLAVDSPGGLLSRDLARDRRSMGDQIFSRINTGLDTGDLQHQIVLQTIHRTQQERHDRSLSDLPCEGDDE